MSHHIGRSFTGHRLEDVCPCPKEPCGLVDTDRVDHACEQHPLAAAKTLRQIHAAGKCAAAHFHRFNANGTAVICTAPADADCRKRTHCDSEGWRFDTGCTEHEGKHPAVPGSECWMTEYINAIELTETFEDYENPPEIVPGAAINLEFIGMDEGCCWTYAVVTP